MTKYLHHIFNFYISWWSTVEENKFINTGISEVKLPISAGTFVNINSFNVSLVGKKKPHCQEHRLKYYQKRINR